MLQVLENVQKGPSFATLTHQLTLLRAYDHMKPQIFFSVSQSLGEKINSELLIFDDALTNLQQRLRRNIVIYTGQCLSLSMFSCPDTNITTSSRFLQQVGNGQIGGHSSRGSAGALVENSADNVQAVLSPVKVKETFESLLLKPLQLLGILIAHFLW